jgi:hypothetical protein
LATLAKLSKKSELAAAIRYALTRSSALTRHRDAGRIEIDNSAAERALRAVALARKERPPVGARLEVNKTAICHTRAKARL